MIDPCQCQHLDIGLDILKLVAECPILSAHSTEIEMKTSKLQIDDIPKNWGSTEDVKLTESGIPALNSGCWIQTSK